MIVEFKDDENTIHFVAEKPLEAVWLASMYNKIKDKKVSEVFTFSTVKK